MEIWKRNRKCVYNEKTKLKKGFILGDYEESGGPSDGQHYVIVEDEETKKVKHVKLEDIQEVYG
jgi:hypothetical protein